MNAVKDQVRDLVFVELAAANEKFPQFHSAHEGWAVIQEEINEMKFDMKWVKKYQKLLFFDIMKNSGKITLDGTANLIKEYAEKAACEAIQVAAMAQKFMDMDEENEKD